eukprot:scaffold176710_cov42-Prasinocladus_malaysianus.AAC.2
MEGWQIDTCQTQIAILPDASISLAKSNQCTTLLTKATGAPQDIPRHRWRGSLHSGSRPGQLPSQCGLSGPSGTLQRPGSGQGHAPAPGRRGRCWPGVAALARARRLHCALPGCGRAALGRAQTPRP